MEIGVIEEIYHIELRKCEEEEEETLNHTPPILNPQIISSLANQTYVFIYATQEPRHHIRII